jgi:hypothetical protein
MTGREGFKNLAILTGSRRLRNTGDEATLTAWVILIPRLCFLG